MSIKFKAQEYTSDDTFINSEYEFSGSEASGWKILRNGSIYLELGAGYKLLKTRLCGVCSTDLDRRFLPFPLPQITGHEVVAEDSDGKKYAVEINDTDSARGESHPDIFCMSGIPTHSPTRKVLGIDRLPGGFGHFILAPKFAAIEIGDVPEMTAVLTEPFAAALQAVIASPPKDGVEVAVLGPRRLGSLLIAALVGYRNMTGKNFKITALARHDHLLKLAMELGADKSIDLRTVNEKELEKRFQIVYDTTSKPEGFVTAMKYSYSEVHLKSTNGQDVCGIKKMTELVVDELSILPYNEENLNFAWEITPWKNDKIFISNSLKNSIHLKTQKSYSMNVEDAVNLLHTDEFKDRLPRFDIGIAGNTKEIDEILRPEKDSENSLVRPRGAILFKGDSSGNPFLEFLNRGGILRSSRCGDFHLALKILAENPKLSESLANKMISHEFFDKDLETAFETAKNSSSVKVIVRHI
jgi:threonine dehydrogenase-like Zn-dependent dehydrogenase